MSKVTASEQMKTISIFSVPTLPLNAAIIENFSGGFLPYNKTGILDFFLCSIHYF